MERCYCSYIPDFISFCSADWISHVKINNKMVQQKNSSSTDMYDMIDTVRYSVDHKNILKKSNKFNNRDLPNVIVTPLDFNSCGLSWLREDDEYILMSQMYFDKVLYIIYCDGLKFDGDKKESIEKIKLWNDTIPCPLSEII
ncbi:Proteinase inhibitor I35, tissue inhibitor of metalloproteinase family and Tissue inhibitor of metalloproteinases-like, OB-fold domain-containing protein [Strongyloides ratti]|uniref:Proteinase inhibitor I35, tissue inhibitor of metalloproteinase family and Tissue inhibitor of metalloproteinases-like, OB-fold domain-containing protein n=1 Tax=Strongyloides ratti TaxID=34506 RepID=A0A090LHY9_STRRB|nr:Proteinase inhibitor I35, tissue inhibitor of metalloproteinase family and Tissue inhibitor of metalloproteinases-like, OB-fold domain-containing protein [Strongyloides ratti]CEF69431.1 Proteinase inhibitor I35, tissue inhibitor of metalloproteinase family and Tissue inhibitor of metalloproteinases-like, OB-fold domain-containing protein [Strongyloides ratti]